MKKMSSIAEELQKLELSLCLGNEQKNPHHWDPHKGAPVKETHLPHTGESHRARGGHSAGDASLTRPPSPERARLHVQGLKKGSSSRRVEEGKRALAGWLASGSPASSPASLPAWAAPTMPVCEAQMQPLDA